MLDMRVRTWHLALHLRRPSCVGVAPQIRLSRDLLAGPAIGLLPLLLAIFALVCTWLHGCSWSDRALYIARIIVHA